LAVVVVQTKQPLFHNLVVQAVVTMTALQVLLGLLTKALLEVLVIIQLQTMLAVAVAAVPAQLV
jgi:hypothetical protein